MIRVCITDDHKLVGEGIKLMVDNISDISIVKLCHAARELFDFLETQSVDVILLDINMPELNGIEACKQLTKNHPHIKIIGLSMISEGHLIKLMIKNGAKGYLHKNASKDEIIEAIHQVHSGAGYLSSEVSNILLSSSEILQVDSPFPKLSRREEQILTLIIDEKTTQEIADQLFISFGTVETHRRNIMIKLGVKNTAGMVRVALEYKLVK
jgi:DNA-binding NarL/FixJ family response regulator